MDFTAAQKDFAYRAWSAKGSAVKAEWTPKPNIGALTIEIGFLLTGSFKGYCTIIRVG